MVKDFGPLHHRWEARVRSVITEPGNINNGGLTERYNSLRSLGRAYLAHGYLASKQAVR